MRLVHASNESAEQEIKQIPLCGFRSDFLVAKIASYVDSNEFLLLHLCAFVLMLREKGDVCGSSGPKASGVWSRTYCIPPPANTGGGNGGNLVLSVRPWVFFGVKPPPSPGSTGVLQGSFLSLRLHLSQRHVFRSESHSKQSALLTRRASAHQTAPSRGWVLAASEFQASGTQNIAGRHSVFCFPRKQARI